MRFIDEDALAGLSPYQTEHINRFGRYASKRVPEPLARIRVLRMPPQSEERCPYRPLSTTYSQLAFYGRSLSFLARATR